MHAALLIAALGFSVEVHGATDCPSPAMVMARLFPILPASAAAQPPDIADLWPESDGIGSLRVRLASAGGALIGTRTIAAVGDCAEMADAVAAILASWEAVLPAGKAEPAAAAADEDRAPAASRPPVASRYRVELSGAGGLQLGSGAAAGLRLEFGLGYRKAPWQVRLGAATEGEREIVVPPGRVRFKHDGVSVSVAWLALKEAWPLSAEFGGSLGQVTLAGSGYPVSETRKATEWGLLASLRAGRRFGRWTLWGELQAALWPSGQRAVVAGSGESADLPAGEAAMSLGVSADLL